MHIEAAIQFIDEANGTYYVVISSGTYGHTIGPKLKEYPIMKRTIKTNEA